MKESAMEQIASLLGQLGLSENEINTLLARFLEEESFNYVECANLNSQHNKKY